MVCGTVDIAITHEAESLQPMKWWIDTSYAVHPDIKGHMGGAFSLEKVSSYIKGHMGGAFSIGKGII